MNDWLAKLLLPHVGHAVVIVAYSDGASDPSNVSLECEDCGEVIESRDLS